MGLIVFEGLFALTFIILFFFLITRKDRYGTVLSLLAFNSTLFTVLLGVLYILFYLEFQGPYGIIITKIIFAAISAITILLFYLTLKAPYFSKNKAPLIFTIILLALNICFVVLFLNEISWDPLRGFSIDSAQHIFGSNISAATVFAVINFLIAPVIFAIVLFIRSGVLNSNIYKQQLKLAAASLLVFAVLETTISWFTVNMFNWLISFLPIGYLALVLMLSSVFSLTVVLDKREIGQNILRFLTFTLVFAVIAGLLTGYFLTFIRNFRMQILSITATAAGILFLRQLIISQFGHIFQSTTEYERKLETALQSLDYEKGRDEVIFTLTEVLKEHVGCSTIDIFISDEKDNLNIDFSTKGNSASFPTNTPAMQFIIEKNIQVLLHTEVVTAYEYIEYKEDLNALFWKTNSDIILFVRDGQKLIAAFALGPRLKKTEYGAYDVEVFKKFYSYFFLVSYYLKNIAKQDIMMTVDREIEMSDQIIGAIQESVNKIEGEIISVDSIAYSAHKLGGDFIDFIQLADGKYFFLIGDVSGKGLSASMSMVILKSILRTYLENSKDFKELVIKLNTFIKENLPRGTFFAGLFGILDLRSQTIYYLNCGIPLMSMYIKSYNNAIEIQGEGRVLGFVKNIAPFLKMRKIKMNPGDIIVFTTDGLLDSENLRGDRFGKDRVSALTVQNNVMSSKKLADEIYTKVTEFVSKGLQDDVTVLVFKHVGNN